MSDENKQQQHQDDEHNKEVSSTQTVNDQLTGSTEQTKEKIDQPLSVPANVKPNSSFKLTHFSGDHSAAKITNWIRMYENLAQRSDWSEDDMLWNLPSYLEHKAFDFYVEHILAKNLDWKQAKQLMIKRFDQYEIDSFMQFLSIKWTPQMELKEYFDKMRALGIESNLKDEDILNGLIRGLPVHLRNDLSVATSLKQWCQVASCLQQKIDEQGSNYNRKSWKGRSGRNSGRNRGLNHQQKRTNQHQNQDHSLLANNSVAESHHEN